MGMEWKTTASKQVYTNPWISVREDAIINPAGMEGIYGVVEIPPGIFAVVLNQQEDILLVRQHRYPTDMTSWELPGGGLKKGYTPEQQIVEELAEEAHMQAKNYKRIGETQTQPGVTTEVDVFFVATGAAPAVDISETSKQEEGIDEIGFFSVSDVLDMLQTGQVNHGQTVTGFMLYLAYTKRVKL